MMMEATPPGPPPGGPKGPPGGGPPKGGPGVGMGMPPGLGGGGGPPMGLGGPPLGLGGPPMGGMSSGLGPEGGTPPAPAAKVQKINSVDVWKALEKSLKKSGQ